jgi:steroid 5-alpha reductase family enzyme
MSIWNVLSHLAILIWAYATVVFALSVLLRRNDIADVAWGLGFVLIGSWFLFQGVYHQTFLWVFGMVVLWALRLALHIGSRMVGKSEDFRYRAWREAWGKTFYWRSYLQVYLLQGAFMFVVAAPIIAAGLGEVSNKWWALLSQIFGSLIFALGLFFETVGDYQLAQFLKNRQDKEAVLDTGLWRYSRHPNYFGDIMVWWGLFLIILPMPLGWLAVIGPLTITFLLVFVSGVPMLERRYIGNAAYDAYKNRTSALIPRPPRS